MFTVAMEMVIIKCYMLQWLSAVFANNHFLQGVFRKRVPWGLTL